MENNIRLLEEAIVELKAAEKKTRAKKALAHIRQALALVNEVHHNLTT